MVNLPRNQVVNFSEIPNYDTYGRISSTTGNNHTNVGSLTAESLVYTYDHGDNILTETRNSAHSAGTTNYVNTRQFDSWGRLTQTSQNLNNAGDKVISQLSYTDKEQLLWKKLGGGLQQIDYNYLPNGLLSDINGTAALTSSTFPLTNMLSSFATPTFTGNNNGDLFREVLRYNNPTAGLYGAAQYNGNISLMYSQVKGRVSQVYGFTYDYLDRMTVARYSTYTSLGALDPVDYFGESVGYDARGNITSITRKGLLKGTSNYTAGTIDAQAFVIPAGQNRASQSTGTNSIPSSSGNFDAPHNYLNLPTKFDFGGNNRIELLYDGQGNKLRKTVRTNNVVTLTQDYLAGIELKNNVVEAVYNEEGRAFNNAGAYRYEYALRDHLGNTRVVFTDKGTAGIQDNTEILSEAHYYPFGKAFDGAWYSDPAAPKYKYLYNGKELIEEFNLNFYDYGARWFDPGMASWWEIDPMGEKSKRWSPYAYGNNNPVRFIDPDGMESAAYGGFTSSAEIAERHEAIREAFLNREEAKDKKGQQDDDKKKEAESSSKPEYDGTYYYPAMDVTKSMSEEGQRTYLKAALIETGVAFMPVGRIFRLMGANTAVAQLGKVLANTGRFASNAGYSIASRAARSALSDRLGKRGFTEVGYQFQKHFGRGGNWAEAIPQGAKLNPATFNEAGFKTFKEIWRAPGSFEKVGNFIEKRLQDGRGIRFQQNWEFKGFLD